MHTLIARLTVAMLAGVAIVTSSPASASTYGVVYSFQGSGDAEAPISGLLNIPGVSGTTLYGTTPFGGTGSCHYQNFSGCGTIYTADPSTGAETVVYSFTGSDGYQPSAALISVGGTLYGTTGFGGANGVGTVFAFDRSTNTLTVLHSFGSGDGTYPFASVTYVGGKLYGTTQYGGTANKGTVYSIDPSTGAESVVYSFQGGTSDGASSIAGLTSYNSKLYGTTLGGGTGTCTGGCGTVFSFDPMTNAESVVYSFQGGSDGANPYAGLINVGSTLFGDTRGGGSGTGCITTGCGVVFSVNPTTGAETVLHTFTGPDGANPLASLINVSGTLYGTTNQGGIGISGTTYGTIYSINLLTGVETVRHSFGNGTDGRSPRTTLINVSGTLYGTTICGGTGGSATSCGTVGSEPGYGTVFSYTP
ncbi:MAG TPA: choice-of-anchor tandem repeat GloVer-containing protein [Rhizomicrobium sp.]|jgi:uncharacterized repeat protein (TIGR03803 family)|nr:choice-of-anchor tandem repeat GloVer-containing protein [Rhizomicrobium sp.]